MKSIKIIISIMLSTVIFLCGIVFPERAEGATSSALSLSVEYPSDIKCGEPITFKLTATGGSGNYKYRIHGLTVSDGSEWVSVYDISHGSNGAYTESDEFTFTFYTSGTYYIRFSAIDMTNYQTATTGMYEHKLVIQDEGYPSVEQIVDKVASQCEKECSADFEKALWLHDWIIDHAEYDYSYSYCSAEGVLARGVGTCESYHRAYVMLLNKVGIQTGRIVGNGHVWTAVKMDDKWYQIDSTWDDMGSAYKDTYYEHMYFGLTDDMIGFVHSDHTAAVPGYESTSLENNYFIKTGEIAQWSDPFVDSVRQNVADGKTEFVLPVTSTMPASYKKIIYNLVAYQLSKTDWGSVNLSVSYADDQLTCKTIKVEDTEGTTIYNGVDYAAVYDYDYYISINGDLAAAFGNDDAAALKHFVEHGMSEGRLAKEDFNVHTYMNRYGDLKAAYGSDLRQYYLHYMNWGKNEGRSGAEILSAPTIERSTVYNGTDYAAVYDYDYYISINGDLAAAFGNDDAAVLKHFVEHGMSEGRLAKEDFNVHTYMNRYGDLKAAYGSDLRQYYLHYMNWGKNEGRSGAETLSTPTVKRTTVYNGTDYAAVYDYDYYISINGDLAAAFGNDDAAALKHFVEHGMSEGRLAKEDFNVHTYMNRYGDLKAAYGSDLRQYYLHYMNWGRNEGRTAH